MSRTKSYGDTTFFDHHILLMRRSMEYPVVDVRYSRCPRDLKDDALWAYYVVQLAKAYPTATLLYVIEDLDHVHPAVIQNGVPHDNGIEAHVP